MSEPEKRKPNEARDRGSPAPPRSSQQPNDASIPPVVLGPGVVRVLREDEVAPSGPLKRKRGDDNGGEAEEETGDSGGIGGDDSREAPRKKDADASSSRAAKRRKIVRVKGVSRPGPGATDSVDAKLRGSSGDLSAATSPAAVDRIAVDAVPSFSPPTAEAHPSDADAPSVPVHVPVPVPVPVPVSVSMPTPTRDLADANANVASASKKKKKKRAVASDADSSESDSEDDDDDDDDLATFASLSALPIDDATVLGIPFSFGVTTGTTMTKDLTTTTTTTTATTDGDGVGVRYEFDDDVSLPPKPKRKRKRTPSSSEAEKKVPSSPPFATATATATVAAGGGTSGTSGTSTTTPPVVSASVSVSVPMPEIVVPPPPPPPQQQQEEEEEQQQQQNQDKDQDQDVDAPPPPPAAAAAPMATPTSIITTTFQQQQQQQLVTPQQKHQKQHKPAAIAVPVPVPSPSFVPVGVAGVPGSAPSTFAPPSARRRRRMVETRHRKVSTSLSLSRGMGIDGILSDGPAQRIRRLKKSNTNTSEMMPPPPRPPRGRGLLSGGAVRLGPALAKRGPRQEKPEIYVRPLNVPLPPHARHDPIPMVRFEECPCGGAVECELRVRNFTSDTFEVEVVEWGRDDGFGVRECMYMLANSGEIKIRVLYRPTKVDAVSKADLKLKLSAIPVALPRDRRREAPGFKKKKPRFLRIPLRGKTPAACTPTRDTRLIRTGRVRATAHFTALRTHRHIRSTPPFVLAGRNASGARKRRQLFDTSQEEMDEILAALDSSPDAAVSPSSGGVSDRDLPSRRKKRKTMSAYETLSAGYDITKTGFYQNIVAVQCVFRGLLEPKPSDVEAAASLVQSLFRRNDVALFSQLATSATVVQSVMRMRLAKRQTEVLQHHIVRTQEVSKTLLGLFLARAMAMATVVFQSVVRQMQNSQALGVSCSCDSASEKEKDEKEKGDAPVDVPVDEDDVPSRRRALLKARSCVVAAQSVSRRAEAVANLSVSRTAVAVLQTRARTICTPSAVSDVRLVTLLQSCIRTHVSSADHKRGMAALRASQALIGSRLALSAKHTSTKDLVLLQSVCRMRFARSNFARLVPSVRTVQSVARTCLALRRIDGDALDNVKRMSQGVVLAQSLLRRGRLVRGRYPRINAMVGKVVAIQVCVRASIGRFSHARRLESIRLLQSVVRTSLSLPVRRSSESVLLTQCTLHRSSTRSARDQVSSVVLLQAVGRRHLSVTAMRTSMTSIRLTQSVSRRACVTPIAALTDPVVLLQSQVRRCLVQSIRRSRAAVVDAQSVIRGRLFVPVESFSRLCQMFQSSVRQKFDAIGLQQATDTIVLTQSVVRSRLVSGVRPAAIVGSSSASVCHVQVVAKRRLVPSVRTWKDSVVCVQSLFRMRLACGVRRNMTRNVEACQCVARKSLEEGIRISCSLVVDFQSCVRRLLVPSHQETSSHVRCVQSVGRLQLLRGSIRGLCREVVSVQSTIRRIVNPSNALREIRALSEVQVVGKRAKRNFFADVGKCTAVQCVVRSRQTLPATYLRDAVILVQAFARRLSAVHDRRHDVAAGVVQVQSVAKKVLQVSVDSDLLAIVGVQSVVRTSLVEPLAYTRGAIAEVQSVARRVALPEVFRVSWLRGGVCEVQSCVRKNLVPPAETETSLVGMLQSVCRQRLAQSSLEHSKAVFNHQTTFVQSVMRMLRCRESFRIQKSSATLFQSQFRYRSSSSLMRRSLDSVVLLQGSIRASLAKRSFRNDCVAVFGLQRTARKKSAVSDMRHDLECVRNVQSLVRTQLVRLEFNRDLRGVSAIESLVRSRLALATHRGVLEACREVQSRVRSLQFCHRTIFETGQVVATQMTIRCRLVQPASSLVRSVKDVEAGVRRNLDRANFNGLRSSLRDVQSQARCSLVVKNPKLGVGRCVPEVVSLQSAVRMASQRRIFSNDSDGVRTTQSIGRRDMIRPADDCVRAVLPLQQRTKAKEAVKNLEASLGSIELAQSCIRRNLERELRSIFPQLDVVGSRVRTSFLHQELMNDIERVVDAQCVARQMRVPSAMAESEVILNMQSVLRYWAMDWEHEDIIDALHAALEARQQVEERAALIRQLTKDNLRKMMHSSKMSVLVGAARTLAEIASDNTSEAEASRETLSRKRVLKQIFAHIYACARSEPDKKFLGYLVEILRNLARDPERACLIRTHPNSFLHLVTRLVAFPSEHGMYRIILEIMEAGCRNGPRITDDQVIRQLKLTHKLMKARCELHMKLENPDHPVVRNYKYLTHIIESYV